MSELENLGAWLNEELDRPKEHDPVQAEPQQPTQPSELDPAPTSLEAFLADELGPIDQAAIETASANLATARERDPDEVGRSLAWAQKHGQAPALYDVDPAGAERNGLQQRDAAYVQQSAAMQRWMQDRNNALVGHDDVENLRLTDQLFNARTAFRRGRATVEFGRSRYFTIFNGGSYADEATEARALDHKLRMMDEGIPGQPSAAGFVLEQTAEVVGSMVEGLTAAAPMALTAGAAAGIAGQIGPQAVLPEEIVTVPTALGVGLAAGVAADTFQAEAGLAYDEFINFRDVHGHQVMEHDVAAGAALLSGIVNGALEAGGLRLLARATGLDELARQFSRQGIKQQLQSPTMAQAYKRFFKGWAGAWSAEVGVEVLQEVAQLTFGELAKVVSSGEFEGATTEEVLERIVDIFTKAGTGMIIPAGIGASPTLVSDTQRARAARQNQQVFEALGNFSSESRVRQRAPERYQRFIEEATAEGPVDTIYVEAERFVRHFQGQGVPLEQLERELPEIAEQREQLAGGGDYAIPTSVYTAKLAGTEHHQSLIRHLRFKPDDLSLAEAEKFEGEFRDELARQVDEAAARADELSEQVGDVEALVRTVTEQQVAAGVDPTVAQQNSELYRAFFSTQAARGNIPDALRAFQRLQFAVRSAASGGPLGPGERFAAEEGAAATPEEAQRAREQAAREPAAAPGVAPAVPAAAAPAPAVEPGAAPGVAPVEEIPEGPYQVSEETGPRQLDAGFELPAEAEIEEIEAAPPPAEAQPPQGTVPLRTRGRRQLANRVAEDFQAGRSTPLLGQQITDGDDLADIALLYRDPRYETLRTIYVRNGEIVYQTGVSTRQADGSDVFVRGENSAEFRQRMIDTMEQLQADGYYLLHNHPSGDSTPSNADRRFTESLARDVPGLQAHVVIDGDNYTVLEMFPGDDGVLHAVARRHQRDLTPPETFSGEPLIPNPLIGQLVRTPQEVADLAKRVQVTPGYMVAISQNRNGVAGILEVSPQEIPTGQDPQSRLRAIALRRRFEMATGGGQVFVVGWPQTAEAQAREAVRTGLLTDVLMEDGASIRLQGQEVERGFERGVPRAERRGGVAVREEAPEFETNELGRVDRVATRVPTAKRGTIGDPRDNATVVELDVATPRWRASTADMLRIPFTRVQRAGLEALEGYPARNLAGELDNDVAIERWVEHATDNILWLYEQVPADIRDRSRRWYEGANAWAQRLAGNHGIEDRVTAGVIAALSPQKDWFMNASLAERVLDTYMDQQAFAWTDEMQGTLERVFGKAEFAEVRDQVSGRRLEELDSPFLQAVWIRTFSETYHDPSYASLSPEGALGAEPLTAAGAPRAIQWGSTAEVSRAVSMLNDADADNVSAQLGTQHKVRSFYNNILDPQAAAGDVTIDTHAIAVAHLRPLSTASREVVANFSVPSDATTGLKGTYAMYSEAYNRAAAARGTLPREMQSITWEAIRGLFSAEFKRTSAAVSVDEAWQAYVNRELSLGETRERILELTGGIDEPFWVGSPPGVDEGQRAASYQTTLPGAGVPGRAPGRVGRGGAPAGPVGTDAGTGLGLFDVGAARERATGGVERFQTPFVARGSIITPERFGEGPVLINLFERADLSTFLHESGHLFLEVFREIAESPAATEQVRADWQVILDWLGVEPGGDISLEQDEQWARGFEQYLFEGRAPSADLRQAFARFRAWLISIYRTIRNIGGVELNDDVREVMDRMLATDEEIAAARQQQNLQPLFREAEQAGMTQAEHQAYLRAVSRAALSARERLEKKQMAEVERERRRWWRDERSKTRDQVETEVHQRPIYQAWHYLRTGTFLDEEIPELRDTRKLNRDALVEDFGREVLMTLPGRGRNLVWQKTGGLHHDLVAEFFGLESGEALVRQLARTQPMRQAIEEETDRRMRERFPGMLDDGSIRLEAMEAVHNDEQLNVLERELTVLAARSGRPEPRPRVLARQLAEEAIAKRPVRDATRIGHYLTAERRAARETERALLAGDIVTATRAKRQQLIQAHLYRAAQRASKEIESGRRRANRLQRPAAARSIDPAYMDQIRGLLEQFDFRPASERELERRRSLRDFLQREAELGAEIAVPDYLIDRAQRTHYSTLSVDHFRGLVDALKNLEHLGRLKKKLTIAGEQRELDEIVSLLTAEARENLPWREGNVLDLREPGAMAKLGDWAELADASHVKAEFLMDRLDGNKPGGVWWEHVFKPIADAENAERVMLEQYVPEIRRLMELYSRSERARWDRRVDVPELPNVRLTRGSLISLALNWGNAENRKAVVDGYSQFGLDERGVERALERLDERDWDFVEGVWELVDSLWPQISELQRRLTGVVPPKVEAVPFQVPGIGRTRTVRGGYYPLTYDSDRSYLTFRREQKQVGDEIHGTSYMRPTTRQGHTIERVGSGGQPVKLALPVVTQHLSNVIHDLTHREAIANVDKLLQQPRIREAIERTVGKHRYRQLRPWLAEVATDRRDPLTAVEHVLRRARRGATVVSMGLKMTTALVQPFGLSNTAELIGERATLRGFWWQYGNPRRIADRWRWVMAKSPAMRNRQRTLDRDLRLQADRLLSVGKLYDVHNFWFALIGALDMAVSTASWYGGYSQELERQRSAGQAEDDARAVAMGDRAVRMSQGSGSAKDLAAIQRGGEGARMFTMFFTFMGTLNNLFRRRFQLTGRDVGSVFRLGTSFVYLVLIPAVIAEWILGRGPDSDEGDEERMKWIAQQSLAFPFATYVGVRDVVNAMTTDYGFGLSPVSDAFETSARFGRGLATGELGRPVTRAGVMTAGYVFGLPSRQAWLTGEYIYDWMNGDVDEFSPYEALVTGDPER